ncbi:MAG: ParB N-terminal domain-containing protein, partial [Acidimicrobiia bacterium]
HIELERSVASIVVGERHRRDPGDLTPLMDSLKRVGLLQPVTITPDGYLICGYRRLEAAKKLGWNTLRVWVRSGISDELTRLLAERDENVTHKPLSTMEATALYKEMKVLLQEDAERRMKANQFGHENGKTAGQPGPAESAGPELAGLGDARRRAAEMVTGKASYNRLEQILEMERVAADRDLPKDLRKVAEDELAVIRNGGPVDPGYQRVRAAKRLYELMQPGDAPLDEHLDDAVKDEHEDRLRRARENRALRRAEAANRKRSTRSFNLKWAEMDGWSKKYDVEQIAREIKPDDWALFLRVIDETKAFAEAVSLAKESGGTPES